MKKKKNYAIWWVLLIAFWSWNISLYANGHYIYGTLLLIVDVVVSAIVILSINSAKQADKKKAEDEERRQRWEAEAEERRRRMEEEWAALEAELDAIPEATITAIQDTTKPKFPKVETPFACSNVTRSTNIDKIFPLVVLDLETTGLSPTKDEIIELSAIKYDVDFEPISKYSVLLKPRKPIPVEATNKNHITDEMVENCVYFSQIADDFAEYIKGCNVCGHNIAKFDLLFLANNGVVIPEKVRVYDTYRIATYYYERRSGLKLADLCDMYDIPLPQAHRALNDCMATAKVFQRLIKLKSN